MKGLAELTKTTLIGGLLVVLPIYLSILLVARSLSAIVGSPHRTIFTTDSSVKPPDRSA